MVGSQEEEEGGGFDPPAATGLCVLEFVLCPSGCVSFLCSTSFLSVISYPRGRKLTESSESKSKETCLRNYSSDYKDCMRNNQEKMVVYVGCIAKIKVSFRAQREEEVKK